MKKRLISVLLLTAMVMTMLMPPVQEAKAAQDPATTGNNAVIDFAASTTQVCPVCGGAAKEWKPLTAITANTALAAGHYYIPEGGLSNKAQYNINSNSTRCIHLNGNTLSSTARVFNITNNGRLNIFGSGKIESTATSTTGAVAYLSTARVYLYGGTISMPKGTTGNPVRLDGANAKLYIYDGVAVASTGRSIQVSNGTVSMNGGTITGGNSSSSGGNVYMSGGSFTMKGGTITGGKANNYGGNVYVGGTFTMSGGTISDGTANYGGNIYLSTSGTFSMTAGTVSGGNATTYGGNIGADTSAFTVAGNVLDGTAGSGGGNISVSSGSELTVSGTVSGGVVTGTTNANWGGNIRAWQATVNVEDGALIYGGNGGGKLGSGNIGCLGEDDGKTAVLNLNGGTVVGDIHTSAPTGTFPGTTVKLSGSPSVIKSRVIDGVTYNSRQGLYIQQGCSVDISEMTGGTICLSGENDQAMTEASANAALLDGCFVAYRNDQQVELIDQVFYLKEKQNAEGDSFAPWENDEKAVCPVCGEEKTWMPYSGTGTLGEQDDGAHVYLFGDLDATERDQVLSVAENATVCFNLNGYTLSMDGRIAITKSGTTLNIMDTAGSGLVSTTGTRTESNLYNYTVVNQNNGTINLYGGTFQNSNSEFAVVRCAVASAKINIYDGAVIDGGSQSRSVYLIDGKLTVNGGIIRNGISSVNGGNIYQTGGTLTIKGGSVLGGTAASGGNLYVADGTAVITDDGDDTTDAPQFVGGTATTGNGGSIYTSVGLTVNAGTISGGKATAGSGGNIYTVGALVLTDCKVSGGQATANYGGNINIAGASSSAKAACSFGTGVQITAGKAKNGGNVYMTQAVLDFSGAEVSDGTATNGAGCLYLATGATLNLSDGIISGGVAGGNGGNIYTSSTNSTIRMTGGTITGGTSNNSGTGTGGGNIFINNGIMRMTGGVISYGNAPKANGGNIVSKAGMNHADNKVVLNDDGNAQTPKPLITGGVSKYTGGNIYINGDRYDDQWSYFTIGDCEITDGDATSYTYGDDISLQHSGRLTVLPSFAGTADIYIPTCCLPADVTSGGAVDATAIVTQGTYPGKLVLEQFNANYLIVGKEGSTQGYICDTGIKKEDGSFLWLTTNDEIVSAAKENANCIVRPVPGQIQLDGGEYVVDLRGNTVHFAGTGTVCLVDTINDSFKIFGTATADEGVTVNTGMAKADEKNYYTIYEEGMYSAHRIDVKLIKISLRHTVGGVYYTGKWACDETLAGHVEMFGVAVSAVDMPQQDFMTDDDTLWSYFDNSLFENGVEKTGVLVTGILKDTTADRIALNAQIGQIPIHAVAYIVIDGENCVGNGFSHSLHDVMRIIDENINTYYKNAPAMQAFMATWKEKGLDTEDWAFTYEPSADAVRLNELYDGRVAFHGEFHDHADTGGKSDGKVNLSKIKQVMEVKGLDFTTILDHYQILHMELDDWDSQLFIGGSEMSTIIHDSPATGKSAHVNMIFSNPEEFKDLMALHNPGGRYPGGKFTFGVDAASGNEYYGEHQWSVAEFKQLIEDIRTCGGMYVFPHPKDGSRYISDNPEDYWFADWVGLEVFYGPSYYAPTGERTVDAYKLWTDLLKSGKYLWATAGSDSHNLPNTNALTTIYSTQKNAVEHFEHAKQGDMTCGPVGIRMCVNDTVTGGQTAFAGQRLSVCISDFHECVLFDGHVYTIKVIAGKGGSESVVYTDTVDPLKPFYYAMDADNTCDYYRVEVYDESDTRITTGMPIAIGNPIWNEP